MRKLHKDKVRKIVLGLPPQDGLNLLVFLGSREDDDQDRLFDRGAPLMTLGVSSIERVREIVESGIVPTAYIVIYILHGQKFNVAIGDAENSIIAAPAMGVDCPWGLHKTVLCTPEDHEVRPGESSWQLYRSGTYKISFHSNGIARAMVALGVKVG